MMHHLHQTGTNQFSTHTLGIKTNIIHGNLLHKLLLHMANTTTSNPCLKYVPNWHCQIIGLEAIQTAQWHQQCLSLISCNIPVVGLSDDTLHLSTLVQHPNKTKTQMTNENILLANEWCVSIEPAQQEGES